MEYETLNNEYKKQKTILGELIIQNTEYTNIIDYGNNTEYRKK